MEHKKIYLIIMMVAIIVIFYSFLVNSWWDTTFDYRREIIGLNETLPLPINGSSISDIDMNDEVEWIYGIGNGTTYIYYNDSNTSGIANSEDFEFFKLQTYPIVNMTGIPPENLTAWYTFDEQPGAINLTDYSRYSRNGTTIQHAPHLIMGVDGTKMFDGWNISSVNDQEYVVVEDSPFGGKYGSVVIWLYTEHGCGIGYSNTERIVCTPLGNRYCLWFQLSGGGIGASAGGTDVIPGGTILNACNAGDTIMLSYTWDTEADNYNIYVNDTHLYNSTVTATDAITSGMNISGLPWGEDSSEGFNGTYYDMKFFNYILDQDAIGILYNMSTSLGIQLSKGSTPNLTIIKPESSVSSKTFLINISTEFEGTRDYCYFNITKGASLEISNTEIDDCSNYTTTVSSDADYILHVLVNDTAGNENYTIKSFTVSTSVVSGGAGGGGGGRRIEEIFEPIKAEYCEPLYPDLKESWEIFKEQRNFKNFKVFWYNLWNYNLCKSSASIIPLEYTTTEEES